MESSLCFPLLSLQNSPSTTESKAGDSIAYIIIHSNLLHSCFVFKPATYHTLVSFSRDVISIDDYASCFDNIDPLVTHKSWTVKRSSEQNKYVASAELRNYVCSKRVQAVFVVSDPVDWSRDVQVNLMKNSLQTFLLFPLIFW